MKHYKKNVINPYIFVRVNSDVQHDDIFTNKTRIEGKHKGYFVWDEDDHTTKWKVWSADALEWPAVILNNLSKLYVSVRFCDIYSQ